MSIWDGEAHNGDTIQILAFWYDAGGSLITGLSPTIDIANGLASSLLVDGAAMTESTAIPGIYYYDYLTTSFGILKCKAISTAGESVSFWLIGSGTLPDVALTSDYDAAKTAATQTSVDAVDGIVDEILADTSAYLDATVSSRLADADYTEFYSLGDIADIVWDEIITGASHNIQNSAGKRLRDIASQVIWTGTAQGNGNDNNQIQLDTNASALDGAYDPSIIAIIDGTGAGQSRLILQYDGATKMATVDRGWRVQPDDSSEFIVYAYPGREHVNEGLAQAGSQNTITLNANASGADDNYVNQLIFIRSGTGEDQVNRVTAYNGTTKVATVADAWKVIPDTTSAYVMLAASLPDLSGFALQSTLLAVKERTDNLPDDPASFIAVEGIVDATEEAILTAISNITDATNPGIGLYPVNISVTDSGLTPIGSVRIEIWNSAETARLASGYTDAGGTVSFNLDEGTYKIRVSLIGYDFTFTSTLVHEAPSTDVEIIGEPISIGTPGDSSLCRVWMWCFDEAGQNPLPHVKATAYLINNPVFHEGKCLKATTFPPVHDSNTGKLYWDIPRLVSAHLIVKECLVDNEVSIPDTAEASVESLLT